MGLSGTIFTKHPLISMNIINVKKHEELVKEALNVIKETIEKSSDICRIALSGGDTPQKLYKKLAKDTSIDFSKVEFYQVDERYVNRYDKHSNYKMIANTLIRPLSGKLKGFYFFDTSRSIDRCVKNYIKDISGVQFDLVLLGMGKDGHIASIFPGDKEAIDSKDLALYTQTDDFPVQDRVTLSLKKIKDAKNIMILLKGKGKKSILNDFLEKDVDVYDLPAKALLKKKKITVIYSSKK